MARADPSTHLPGLSPLSVAENVQDVLVTPVGQPMAAQDVSVVASTEVVTHSALVIFTTAEDKLPAEGESQCSAPNSC